MVKVFTTNANGKIEFTKEELEILLNEVWNDCYNRHVAYRWTSPTISVPLYRDGVTVTCNSGEEDGR